MSASHQLNTGTFRYTTFCLRTRRIKRPSFDCPIKILLASLSTTHCELDLDQWLKTLAKIRFYQIRPKASLETQFGCSRPPLHPNLISREGFLLVPFQEWYYDTIEPPSPSLYFFLSHVDLLYSSYVSTVETYRYGSYRRQKCFFIRKMSHIGSLLRILICLCR